MPGLTLEALRALELLRERWGFVYGSEDLCVLLYALARRERPRKILELGSGLGVCSLWIARALHENGAGHLWSIDSGIDFDEQEALRTSVEEIRSHEAFGLRAGGYHAFLAGMAEKTRLGDAVSFVKGEVRFGGSLPGALLQTGREPIDWLFSDISHGPEDIIQILGFGLPLMASTSSIFIDSASTWPPSRELLDRFAASVASGDAPDDLIGHEAAERTRGFLAVHQIELVHLTEARARRQNSTAWLRIRPK